MNGNIESFQRAAKKVMDYLVAMPSAPNLQRHQGGIERRTALEDAQAVKIIAAALLGASEVAIEALRPPPPPAQYYHSHNSLRPQIGPIGAGEVTGYERAGPPTPRSAA